MIALDAVKFNLETVVAGGSLNVRKNATEPIALPEWRRGGSVNFEDSVAAFALAGLEHATMHIAASFSSDEGTLRTAEIRAVDNLIAPPPLVRSRVTSILQRVSTANTEVPVSVRERNVPFHNGATGMVRFELSDPKIDRTRVGLYDCEWQWQYRVPGDPVWRRFAISRHRIYVTLDIPSAPWKQMPYESENTQLLWTDVLDYACSWAAGAQNTVEAATAITKRVNDLAPHLITFDAPGAGSAHYAWSNFDCSAFLERLAGGIGNGMYVNATDCATIVSTFANAIGCDLWQSRMGYGFSTNPAMTIGSKIWQKPALWPGFSYHEVAWENSCSEDDRVYDASMTIDGGLDPTQPPHTAISAAGLPFGHATGHGEISFRTRLAAPAGLYPCQAQPQTRTRRVVI
ncbi:MAG TPA: hypothetical protein VME66_10365 [Candidatus Acidoferrales bacterium]|nr:hypothetical protein [Candidatus Acidoferrales bacterium]